MARNAYGNTVLHLAIINNNYDAITIIRKKYNLFYMIANNKGKTPDQLVLDQHNHILQNIYFIPNIDEMDATFDLMLELTNLLKIKYHQPDLFMAFRKINSINALLS